MRFSTSIAPIALILLMAQHTLTYAAEFMCAGVPGAHYDFSEAGMAAKAVQRAGGTRRAVVLFAKFRDENPDQTAAPPWSARIFDPELPGSFSHFYDTMSFGKLQVRGEAINRQYESAQPATAYVADDPTEGGDFGRFSLEILAQADSDVDFSRFDNDGPDGVPDSGDDDGAVDAVFIVMPTVPANFLLGPATGSSFLGFDEDFISGDVGADGTPIRVSALLGTIQQGRSFSEAVGPMCHEYGHVLGLPDLFNTEFLRRRDVGPEEDSAGIGAWGLMGHGATGWPGADGPNSFSAWSRMRLGWSPVLDAVELEQEVTLEPVGNGGAIARVGVDRQEFFLLEYRTSDGSYYDRHIPGEGLLVWHIRGQRGDVDLECADGRWADAGYPLGRQADAGGGGDNLDFWAHDTAYRERHGGNLGDATDPFDGVHFTRFGTDTNPASHSHDGSRSIRLEGLEMAPSAVTARVLLEPARLQVTQASILDANRDGLFVEGEEGMVQLWVTNLGGVPARDIRVLITTADSHVEILQAQSAIGDLGVGEFGATYLPDSGPPRFLLRSPSPATVDVHVTVRASNAESVDTTLTERIITRVELSGLVTDEQGVPLAGVTFDVLDQARSSGSSRFTTDAVGRFATFVLPGEKVIHHADDTSNELTRYDERYDITGDTQLHIVLHRLAGQVHGVVTDEKGRAVSDVTIANGHSFLVPVGARSWGQVGSPRSTITGADGRYRLDVPLGTQHLWVIPFDGQRLSGYADLRFGPVEVQGDTQVDLELGRGRLLELDVGGVSSDRSSLLLVSGSGAHWQGRGSPFMYLSPGPHRVWLYYYSSASYPGLDLSLIAPVLQDTTIAIQVPTSQPVTGRFLHRFEGLPAEQTVLFSDLEGRLVKHRLLDAADGFREGLPNGRYAVTYVGWGPEHAVLQSAGVISVEGETDLVLATRSAISSSLWLQGAAGEFLPGHGVYAVSTSGVAAAAAADLGGRAELSLPAGRYRLSVTSPDRKTLWQLSGEVDLGGGETALTTLPGGKRVRAVVSSRTEALNYVVDEPLVVELTDDPLRPTFILRPSVLWEGNGMNALLSPPGPTLAAALVGPGEPFTLFAEPGRRYLVVLPRLGNGVGSARALDLPGDTDVEVALPESRSSSQLYGRITAPADGFREEVVLRFYDERTGIVAQWWDRDVSTYRYMAVLGKQYLIELPTGRYRVRAGLVSVTEGFYAQYDLGEIGVSGDRKWDIDLGQVQTAVDEASTATPFSFALHPGYPNPFNSEVTLAFSVPRTGEVELAVFNLLGQRVRTLLREPRSWGLHEARWDGRDNAGMGLATGIYLVRLQAGSDVDIRKLLMVK